jgi:pimeloyl-ACP methyl ester carboxylesterase
MYVEWIAPEEVTRPWPLVLVHGGGGQGTDWLTTPDGRAGWAYLFAAAGFAVYIVDRPGHGRSPYHPDVLGAAGPQTSSEVAAFLFAGADPEHTQWPWGRSSGAPELEQLAAGMSFLLDDAALSQQLDGEALSELLAVTGPAVLVTHSAGAPAGWLALNAVPDLVAGVIAIEPMGPPFADLPGFPTLRWGLTTAPMRTDPAVDDPARLAGPTENVRVLGLEGADVLVVAGAASDFGRGVGPGVAEFLRGHGADARFLNLADRGISGNGHGLMLEANNERTIEPLLEWLGERAAKE